MEVEVPELGYRTAIRTSAYLQHGLQTAIGAYLGIELTGAERFQILGYSHDKCTVRIKVDSDWVQPTRA